MKNSKEKKKKNILDELILLGFKRSAEVSSKRFKIKDQVKLQKENECR